jgi:hypothetical protein
MADVPAVESLRKDSLIFHQSSVLLSQLEMFLEIMSTMLSAKKERSHRLAPVTEMFEHIGEQKKLYRALGQSGRLHDFFDLAQGYFARGIEQRLKETKFQPDASQTEQVLLSVALAGSLLSLFRWWMDTGGKLPASSMDKHFHRMAGEMAQNTAKSRQVSAGGLTKMVWP